MKFPKSRTITHRISAVTNRFVQAILPETTPTDEEYDALLAQLGMQRDKMECVYCGSSATDWDHLRPLVKNRRPTNNLTNHYNMVPACGPCNQSKGGRDWRVWIDSSAISSPKFRNVQDLDRRIELLTKIEAWGEREQADLSEIIGPELWTAYWDKLGEVERCMREGQEMASTIRAKIEATLTGIQA